MSVAHWLDNAGMLNIINKPLLGYIHFGGSLKSINDDFPLFLETIFRLAIAANLAGEADGVAQAHTATFNTPLNFAVVDSVVEDGGVVGLKVDIAPSASPAEAVSDENYDVDPVLASTFTDVKDITSLGDLAKQTLTTGKHLNLSATMNMSVDDNLDKVETACVVTEPFPAHWSEEISAESIPDDGNLEITQAGNTDDPTPEDAAAVEAPVAADEKVTLTVENEELVTDASSMIPVEDISFEDNKTCEAVALASEKFAETATGDLGAADISSTENATSENDTDSDELLTTASSGATDDEETNNVEPVSITGPCFRVVSDDSDDFHIAASSVFDADFERFLKVDDAWFVPQLHEASKAERDNVRERLVNRSTSQFNLQKLLLERASRALSLEATAPAEVVPRPADIASMIQGLRAIGANINPVTPNTHSDDREAIVRLKTASAADPMHSRSVSSRYALTSHMMLE